MRTSKPEDGARFGFVVGRPIDKFITRVEQIVEKPGVGKAPSELFSVSGMIIQPEIISFLEKADKELSPGKELYHIYGLNGMLEAGLPIYAVEYQNCRYFDTGDKLGYLKALVELGLESPEFGEKFRKFLQDLIET